MLTTELKDKIDNMSFYELRLIYRRAPIGDELLSGKVGKYFIETMNG